MKRKTLAIPLRLVNFSDTSQVVTLYTLDHGVVEAIAKGAHRERNAFEGPFDLAVLWEVVFAERPAERGLSIITEGTVTEGFRGLRRSWDRWAAAAFVLEYLRAVGTAGEPAGELFDLAAAALWGMSRLPEGRPPAQVQWSAALVSWFEARALRLLGLTAPLAACSNCSRPWSRSDRAVFYSLEHGGILCGRCQNRAPAYRGLSVQGRVLRTLDELAARPARGIGGPPALEPVPVALESCAAALEPGPVESCAPALESGAPGPPGLALARPALGEPSGQSAEVLAALRRILGEIRIYCLDHSFQMIRYLPF